MAREQAQKAVNQGLQSETSDTSNAAVSSATTSTAANAASTSNGLASSPSSVAPIAAIDSQQLVSGSSGISISHSSITSSTIGVEPSTVVTMSTAPTTVAGSSGVATNSLDSKMPSIIENQASQDFASSNGASLQDIEDAKRGLPVVGKINVTPPEEKTNDDETLVYANKLEAKNAFKALLESVNVQSDWTWEQAMREIINDKRYNALKTLGERKQAFNEYLGQRKKLEAEERRMKQKRAREEFTKMLEECKELTSSTRWSKAISMFENDERFNAVERLRDREDLFESYMVELERKEKENAAEEHRRSIAEYRKFLESCDYVKVNSQWRKIQDRLEDDDRYLRLEKIDRLLVFQDRLRRSERKNRDAFRKLLEEHVAAGVLNAKTPWREYCLKVKVLPQYQAVASNTSGSTPRDLFEDVVEDLENSNISSAKMPFYGVGYCFDYILHITVVATSVFEDFKSAVLEEVAWQTISETNLKLIFEELLERAKEKEEKEAKKRQRLADDFTNLLYTFKDITTTSNGMIARNFLRRHKSTEFLHNVFCPALSYRSIGDESYSREIFEEYVTYLKEKAKEKERKREEEKAKKEKEREEKEKRKEKEKKEKDREREKEKSKERHKKEETDSDKDITDSRHDYKEEKKKEKDKERKHRKRRQSSVDDVDSEKDEKEESKKSRRHGSERKKSRKHANSPESENESRHRRHKREHWDGSRKTGGHEELEDGELGDDVEA
ncbi:FF domain [Sesbania bispinosa]|nr:FF domain [Sesbania bispinosa]